MSSLEKEILRLTTEIETIKKLLAELVAQSSLNTKLNLILAQNQLSLGGDKYAGIIKDVQASLYDSLRVFNETIPKPQISESKPEQIVPPPPTIKQSISVPARPDLPVVAPVFDSLLPRVSNSTIHERKQSPEILEYIVNDSTSESKPGFYKITGENVDEWGIISEVKSDIESYSHLTYLLFTKFFYLLIVEIHRFRHDDDNLVKQVIENISNELNQTGLRFVKAAPSSQILQRLYRKRLDESVDLEREYVFNEEELTFARKKAREFYIKIQKAIEDNESIELWKKNVQKLIDSFHLGGATIETRIVMSVFAQTKEVWQKITDMPEPSIELITKLASVELLLDAAKFIATSQRFRLLLEEVRLI